MTHIRTYYDFCIDVKFLFLRTMSLAYNMSKVTRKIMLSSFSPKETEMIFCLRSLTNFHEKKKKDNVSMYCNLYLYKLSGAL